MKIASPLLFLRLLIFALIVISYSPVLAQDSAELDAFLATPVPAVPIPEETARNVIEKGTALAANASQRSNEITAYLIPFQRALKGAAGPESTPTPLAAAPPAKPFLILKSSDGKAEFFKATSVTNDGPYVIAQSADGKKGMWQKNGLMTQLPWYTPEEMESGGVDLPTLTLRYKALETTFPGLKPVLEAEMKSIQAVATKLRTAVEQKKAKLNEEAARVIAQAQAYSQDHPYTREELAGILLNAEETRKRTPEQAVNIDQALVPLRNHFEHLLANDVLYEGVWLPKAQVEEIALRKRMAEQEQAFEKELHVQLGAEVISKSALRNILVGLGIVALIVFSTGLNLLVFRESLIARGVGLLFCLAPASIGIYGNWLLSARDATSPEFAANRPSGTNKLIHLLFLTSKPKGEPVSELDQRITLRESDLNSFINDYVTFTGALPDGGLYRTDLGVQLLSDKIIVWELARLKNRPFRIRYEIRTEGAELKTSNAKVVIGKLALPGPVASMMVGNLLNELGKIKKGESVLESYKMTRLTEGETDLTSAQRSPARSVDPSPAPTGDSSQTTSVPAAHPAGVRAIENAPVTENPPAENAQPSASPNEDAQIPGIQVTPVTGPAPETQPESN